MPRPAVVKIHLEPTSRCNAVCRFCRRRARPAGTSDLALPSLGRFLRGLSVDECILCGSEGEPTLHPEFDSLLAVVARASAGLMLHTNGATHSEAWWAALPSKLSRFPRARVTFGLDGLADTHQRHRTTSFEVVTTNLRAFIRAGGRGVWHCVLFRHNELQLAEIEAMAKEIGAQLQVSTSQAYDEICAPPTTIPPGVYGKVDYHRLRSLERASWAPDVIRCLHEIFIKADGTLHPCVFVAREHDGALPPGATPVLISDFDYRAATASPYFQLTGNGRSASCRKYCATQLGKDGG
jgi:MoaA/NifB/PqqE/SkfB family radical SAM enzyme